MCLLLNQLHGGGQAGDSARRPHLSWANGWSHISSDRGKHKWRGQERVIKIIFSLDHHPVLSLSERARAYFSQLQRDVVLELFELFRVDFEMFGYDAKEYLDVAGSKHTPSFPADAQTMSTGDFHLNS